METGPRPDTWPWVLPTRTVMACVPFLHTAVPVAAS